MTSSKKYRTKVVLRPEGKARVDSVPSVPSVPNGNHIGDIGPKDKTMSRTFFWVKDCSMCFPFLTPKVRGEGGRGPEKTTCGFSSCLQHGIINSNSH